MSLTLAAIFGISNSLGYLLPAIIGLESMGIPSPGETALVAAAVLARNPTAIGGETALRQEPRGIVRVTRHPMLWSFALWAAVHVLGNGDVASLLFFGAFLLTALAGMPSIDAKVGARDPEGWRHFAAATSILPFGAITSGRNRFAPAEIGWAPVALGVALWAVLLWAHPWIFGLSALPSG